MSASVAQKKPAAAGPTGVTLVLRLLRVGGAVE